MKHTTSTHYGLFPRLRLQKLEFKVGWIWEKMDRATDAGDVEPQNIRVCKALTRKAVIVSEQPICLRAQHDLDMGRSQSSCHRLREDKDMVLNDVADIPRKNKGRGSWCTSVSLLFEAAVKMWIWGSIVSSRASQMTR